jgi:hypothetical protein
MPVINPVQLPSPQNQPSQLEQEDSDFGNSSGPLFSLYSKIAEEDDNKMTNCWQKYVDGIPIFVSDLDAILIAPPNSDTRKIYMVCSPLPSVVVR